jgi:hypothetical protein
MAVHIKRWLKLHPGSRFDNRMVTLVKGRIGRDTDGDFACGVHFEKLRLNQAGTWSCPRPGCETRIETKQVG